MNTTSLSSLVSGTLLVDFYREGHVVVHDWIDPGLCEAAESFVLEYTRNELKTAFRINIQGKDTSELLAMPEQQWAQSSYKARRIKKLSPLN